MTVDTSTTVTALYLKVGAVFGAIAAVALAITSWQLVLPDLVGGVELLTYGRLRPVAINALVYGWLVISLAAVALRVVAGAAPLWQPRLAMAGLGLAALGVLVGSVLLLTGSTDVDFLFEYPLVADILLAVGLAVVGFVAARTVAGADDSDSPGLWFSLAGLLWLPLGFVAGSVPGFAGINASLQNAFGVVAITVVAIGSMAIGAAYDAVAAATGEYRGTRVSRLAFWSFAFIAAWTAPRLLAFGPAADWLETIAIAFSFILLVPVLAILADLAAASRGLTDRRLLVAGGVFLAVFAVLNLVASFRSPSSVVRFTGWEDALLFLPLLGTAACWMLVSVGTRWRWTGLLLTVGTGTAVLAWLAAGLHQGISWVGGVNEGSPVSAGADFVASSTALLVIVAVGIELAAIAILIAAYRRFRPLAAALEANPAPAEDGDEDVEYAAPIAMTQLARGAVGLFALAAVSVFIIPSFDAPNHEATLTAEERRFEDGSLEATGQDLYVSEGCIACHTQQVRPIIGDVGLGAVSLPGDYADVSPVLLGTRRIGPDLTHIGERADSTRFLLERLRSPRSGDADKWEIMPSYDYLSDADLLAIAEYLGALN